MKDYTYNNDKTSLDTDAFHWLSNIGFLETQWILDTKWLSREYKTSYKKWIGE